MDCEHLQCTKQLEISHCIIIEPEKTHFEQHCRLYMASKYI